MSAHNINGTDIHTGQQHCSVIFVRPRRPNGWQTTKDATGPQLDWPHRSYASSLDLLGLGIPQSSRFLYLDLHFITMYNRGDDANGRVWIVDRLCLVVVREEARPSWFVESSRDCYTLAARDDDDNAQGQGNEEATWPTWIGAGKKFIPRMPAFDVCHWCRILPMG